MAAGNFDAVSFDGSVGGFDTDGAPSPTPPTPTVAPSSGGSAGGRYRTAMSLQRARRKREENEVAMILQAVMPMIAAGVTSPDEIFLPSQSPMVDKGSN